MLETAHPPCGGCRVFGELTHPCVTAIAKATAQTPEGTKGSHPPVWGKRRGNKKTLISWYYTVWSFPWYYKHCPTRYYLRVQNFHELWTWTFAHNILPTHGKWKWYPEKTKLTGRCSFLIYESTQLPRLLRPSAWNFATSHDFGCSYGHPGNTLFFPASLVCSADSDFTKGKMQ